MEMPIELEQDAVSRQDAGDVEAPLHSPLHSSMPNTDGVNGERSRASGGDSGPSSIQEASFRVLESGRIRFFVCPRIETDVPTSLEDIQRFSFTLAPRNRDRLRRLSVATKRLPDSHARDKQYVVVDHVTAAKDDAADAISRSDVARGRMVRSGNYAGSIEVAAGTYAIASHRDHVHFLYELELENGSVSSNLLRQLRIVPRTSYVAAVPRTSGSRGERFARLDPALLEQEGTVLVLVTGEEGRVVPSITFARS